jgi:DNA-binding NarL/FixJ family response regulator
MPSVLRPRIVIADDHTLIAEAFRKLLTSDFDVVALVHDGHSLIQTVRRLRPDVIVVDIGMPLLSGLEAAQRIKRATPEVKVVYVTINDDPDVVKEALRRGASAYVLKTAGASELVAAVRSALKGSIYVSPFFRNVADSSSQLKTGISEAPRLTHRQVDVLQLLAEGKSMKETAAVLNLTTRTVAFHKYRIMEYLGLKNHTQVVRYAMRRHLICT